MATNRSVGWKLIEMTLWSWPSKLLAELTIPPHPRVMFGRRAKRGKNTPQLHCCSHCKFPNTCGCSQKNMATAETSTELQHPSTSLKSQVSKYYVCKLCYARAAFASMGNTTNMAGHFCRHHKDVDPIIKGLGGTIMSVIMRVWIR